MNNDQNLNLNLNNSYKNLARQLFNTDEENQELRQQEAQETTLQEIDNALTEIDKVKTKLEARKREILINEIAKEYGLNDNLKARLRGTTESELREDAYSLSQLLTQSSSRLTTPRLSTEPRQDNGYKNIVNRLLNKD